MPSESPLLSETTQAQLTALGEQIRVRRKALRLSATVVAEAAGLSRVTLHRIEKGAPSVTIGAWANVLAALKMTFAPQAGDVAKGKETSHDPSQWIPVRVPLADYPQLQTLAWQVHGVDALSPAEAHAIYERNARHLEEAALSRHEAALMQALRTVFGAADV
jgi:transcriptional regulator with XRE-family HTH domain